MPANGARPVVLTAVQARRVLAYLTLLERAVVEDEVSADRLPMWEQLEEVILGLDGLSLTIDAVTEALGDDGDGGGEGGGVREPRQPPPDGGLAHDELEPADDKSAPAPVVLPSSGGAPAETPSGCRLAHGGTARR